MYRRVAGPPTMSSPGSNPTHRRHRSPIMTVDRQPRTRLGRFLAGLALVLELSGTGLVGPAVVAPTHTDAAQATVYSSCTISRCSAARTAPPRWRARGWRAGP